jgi:anthranilate phosphoribosyltransferase
MPETKIQQFGHQIAEILKGKNLNRPDSKEMFRQVLMDEQPALQQGAFLAAMTAKGETAEEIAGAWEAIYELDTVKVNLNVSQPVLENSGTGMDALKTFNISTAAAIIAAANGVCLARHGARALTSACGTVDILEALGVDVECEVEVVQRSIETTGIGVFNGMSSRVHPQALFRILSQISFGSTFNIAGSLSNPARPRYGLRGVHSRDLVEPVGKVMKEIGYRRAMVVHGLDGSGRGMDEISTLGDTLVAELNEKGEIKNYRLNPLDLGIQPGRWEDLVPSTDRAAEVRQFLRLLKGTGNSTRKNIVCLNAAPLFYLAGQVATLKEGYFLAQETLESGRALVKLKEWVNVQNRQPENGRRKLEALLAAVQAG